MEAIKLHQFVEKLELLGYSKRTIAGYQAAVRLFFAYLRERENVQELGEVLPEHLTAYHTYLRYDHTKPGSESHLSAASVAHRLAGVKKFYRVMFDDGLIAHDYAPLIRLPRITRPLPRNVPTEADMAALLDSIAPDPPLGLRDRAMFELLYAAGMRSAELLGIEIDDVDLDAKTLLIHGKGSRQRIVPVGAWVVPWLREYLHAGRPFLVNHRDPVALLFLSKKGRPIPHGNLCACMRKHALAAGLACVPTPHAFRHACATHMLHGGASIRYIQELLGHADLASTQIYTRVEISHLKEAHDRYHPRQRG